MGDNFAPISSKTEGQREQEALSDTKVTPTVHFKELQYSPRPTPGKSSRRGCIAKEANMQEIVR